MRGLVYPLVKLITFGLRCRICGGGSGGARVAHQRIRCGGLRVERGQERIRRGVGNLERGRGHGSGRRRAVLLPVIPQVVTRETIVPTATVTVVARCRCCRGVRGRGRIQGRGIGGVVSVRGHTVAAVNWVARGRDSRAFWQSGIKGGGFTLRRTGGCGRGRTVGQSRQTGRRRSHR